MVSGLILVGADGSTSAVRKTLGPMTYPVHRLPINALGVSLDMTEDQFDYFRKNIDPLYFMGTHPETDTYVFWSLLESPKEKGTPYPAQLYFSWHQSEADNCTSSPCLRFSSKRRDHFFCCRPKWQKRFPRILWSPKLT